MTLGRKLNFEALKWMNGETVIVRDLTGEVYDQLCEVKVHYYQSEEVKKAKRITKKNRFAMTVVGIDLTNEEFLFSYGMEGKCTNGLFECYSKEVKE